jgi:hypothetical protein
MAVGLGSAASFTASLAFSGRSNAPRNTHETEPVYDSLSKGARMRWIGSQPAQDNRLDHLEKALTRAAAQATALIEQSRRDVERARVLLKDEQRQADGTPRPT